MVGSIYGKVLEARLSLVSLVAHSSQISSFVFVFVLRGGVIDDANRFLSALFSGHVLHAAMPFLVDSTTTSN